MGLNIKTRNKKNHLPYVMGCIQSTMRVKCLFFHFKRDVLIDKASVVCSKTQQYCLAEYRPKDPKWLQVASEFMRQKSRPY